jgi:hypothetical protein
MSSFLYVFLIDILRIEIRRVDKNHVRVAKDRRASSSSISSVPSPIPRTVLTVNLVNSSH